MKRLIASLSFLFVATVAKAAPAITSISGSLTNGSTMTIVGSGFQTKSPARPQLYANFDDGNINPSTHSVFATAWSNVQMSSYATTDTDFVGGYADSANNWQATITNLQMSMPDLGYGSTYYASVVRKTNLLYPCPAGDPNCSGSQPWNWKTGMRIWKPAFNLPDLYHAGKSEQASPTDTVAFVEFNSGAAITGDNRWYPPNLHLGNSSPTQIEWELIASTGNASKTGIVRYREGRSTTYTKNNAQLDDYTSPGRMTNFNFQADPSNQTPAATTYYRQDEIYLDNTLARVELSTTSSFVSAGRNLLQIPFEWADGQIKLNTYTGGLADGTQLWARVVDKDGNASAAYGPVLVGSGAGTVDATPAGYVQNLGVAASTVATTGTANKIILTLSTNVAIGQTIIVRAASEYTNSATTITDAKGNTYSSLRTAGTAGATAGTYDGSGNILTNPVGNRCSTFWCPNLTTSLVVGDTITVQYTTGFSTTLRDKVAIADQFRGLAGTVDTQTGLNGTGAGFGDGLGAGNTGLVGSGFTSTAGNCIILHNIFTQEVDGSAIEIAPSVDQLTQKGVSTVVVNPIRSCAGWKWTGTSGSYPINFKVASGVKWQVQSFSLPLASSINEARDYITVANSLNPVAFYKLDEAAGSFVDSIHGSGIFNGAAHGTVSRRVATPVVAIPNGAIKVNGATGNYVEFPDQPEFSVATTGSLTVCAWVRPDTLNNTLTEGADPEGTFVSWFGKALAGANEYKFRMYNKYQSDGVTLNQRPNRISAYHFKAAGGLGSGSYFQDNLTAGGWIFVSASYNSVGPAIWKDGAWRDGDFYSDYAVTPTDTTSPVRVGTSDGASYANAAFGPVLIYPRKLTDEEVYRLYLSANNAASGTAPSLASANGLPPWITR